MPEPRVRAGCVQRVLRRATFHGRDPDAAAAISSRAGFTVRTFDRMLEEPEDKLISLDRADRWLTAAGGHLQVDCTDEELV